MSDPIDKMAGAFFEDGGVKWGLLTDRQKDEMRSHMRAAVLALKAEFQDPVVKNALQFVADAKGQTP